MTTLPPISSVPSLSTLERASILDTLFEPCTQLHTLSVSALHEDAFSSYNDLVAHVSSQLNELLQSKLHSDRTWLDAILSAHPRLGETKVDSALSREEQAGLRDPQEQSSGGGEDSGAKGDGRDEELEVLRALNGEYEAVFEGLKFVTFVNGRSRPEIMEEMKTKINEGKAGTRTADNERKEAIEALSQIALDRTKKLSSSP